MSASDTVSDGTFELLDNLPAKPRQLYIERLSKKELVAIVAGVWEERDARGARMEQRTASARASVKSTTDNSVLGSGSQVSPVAIDGPSGSRKRPRLAEVGKKSVVRTARDPSPIPNAMRTWADRTNVPYTDEDVQRIVMDFLANSENGNNNNAVAHTPLSKPNGPKALESVLDRDGNSSDELWERFPLVLQVPGDPSPDPEHYNATFVDIPRVPDEVGTNIYRRWRGVLSFITYKHNIERLLRNWELNLDRGVCLRCRAGGIYRHVNNFTRGGGLNNEGADDFCLERRVPCVYLMDWEGEATLCVKPIPEYWRAGKEWADVGFWINGGSAAPIFERASYKGPLDLPPLEDLAQKVA